MRKLLSTVAIGALVASPAFAGDNTDVSQAASGVQDALNTINVAHNNTNIDQEATNAANLIDKVGTDTDLDDVYQSSDVVQTIRNSADTVHGQWNDTVQDGVNVSNNVAADDVEDITQIGNSEDQSVRNVARYGQWIEDLEQTGTNLSNGVDVDDVSGSVDQDATNALDQTVDNDVAYNAKSWAPVPGDGHFVDLVQEGTNVANQVNADDLGNLDQHMDGEQIVNNTAGFGDDLSSTSPGTEVRSRQTGLNGANLATITGEFEQASQTVSPMADQQTVTNRLNYVGDGGQYLDGDVTDFGQEGTNVANMLQSDSMPSTTGIVEVSQTASLNQSVSNSINGQGALKNVSQSVSNIANSVGDLPE